MEPTVRVRLHPGSLRSAADSWRSTALQWSPIQASEIGSSSSHHASMSGRAPLRTTTLYVSTKDQSPEEMLVAEMFHVDLHHGEYSHDPPWTILEVFGAEPNPAVERTLRDYGVTRVERTESGFIARRPRVTRTSQRS